MKSTILKYGIYGLVTGMVIFSLHLILGVDKLESSTNEILGFVSIFIALSFVYFGIKYYKDRVNNGVISIGKAFVIGTIISIMVGIGVAIADFVYTTLINPSFFDTYEQTLRDQGRADEIIKMTSATAALFMLVLVTLIGCMISLISGLLLQHKTS